MCRLSTEVFRVWYKYKRSSLHTKVSVFKLVLIASWNQRLIMELAAVCSHFKSFNMEHLRAYTSVLLGLSL